MCTRPMAQFVALLAVRVVAAPERVLAIRFKHSAFLRPFSAAGVGWYPGSVAIARAGPGPRAQKQRS